MRWAEWIKLPYCKCCFERVVTEEMPDILVDANEQKQTEQKVLHKTLLRMILAGGIFCVLIAGFAMKQDDTMALLCFFLGMYITYLVCLYECGKKRVLPSFVYNEHVGMQRSIGYSTLAFSWGVVVPIYQIIFEGKGIVALLLLLLVMQYVLFQICFLVVRNGYRNGIKHQ